VGLLQNRILCRRREHSTKVTFIASNLSQSRDLLVAFGWLCGFTNLFDEYAKELKVIREINRPKFFIKLPSEQKTTPKSRNKIGKSEEAPGKLPFCQVLQKVEQDYNMTVPLPPYPKEIWHLPEILETVLAAQKDFQITQERVERSLASGK
jgi:hypothetical protein